MIYAIKQFIYVDDPHFGKHLDDCGTVGYFFSKEEAIMAILENRDDLCECCYGYCAVMGFKPGLYNSAEGEQWFKWDEFQNKYVTCVRPVELEGFAYML